MLVTIVLLLSMATGGDRVRILLRSHPRGSIYAVAARDLQAARKIWQGNEWGVGMNTEGVDSASGAAKVDGRIILTSKATERKLWLKRLMGRAEILVPAEF